MNQQQWEERYLAKEGQPLPPPSLFLQRHLRRIPPGAALDIACGDGRHAVYLARHGFRVDGIDRAWAGLRRAGTAARMEQLSIRLIQADLTNFPLPRKRYSVAVNVRYLERSLWSPLKQAVRPGGVVVVETFLLDQLRLGLPMNHDFLLHPDELREAFRDFDLLDYEEGFFESESGPAYLARLLARRPDDRT